MILFSTLVFNQSWVLVCLCPGVRRDVLFVSSRCAWFNVVVRRTACDNDDSRTEKEGDTFHNNCQSEAFALGRIGPHHDTMSVPFLSLPLTRVSATTVLDPNAMILCGLHSVAFRLLASSEKTCDLVKCFELFEFSPPVQDHSVKPFSGNTVLTLGISHGCPCARPPLGAWVQIKPHKERHHQRMTCAKQVLDFR